MTTKSYKLLVFDWDGTLMDSEARIVSCLERAINDMSLPVHEKDTLKDIIGLGMREAILALFPEADDQLVVDFTDSYRTHFFSDQTTASELFPGVIDTLSALHRQDYLLAVATGKGRRGLDRALDETGCKAFFHTSRCADESFSKPHPQMLLEIMTDLDIAPAETLMIGDTEYDLQMAENAGVSSIAVSYGVHERERLMSFKPLACLDDISEVHHLLNAWHNIDNEKSGAKTN